MADTLKYLGAIFAEFIRDYMHVHKYYSSVPCGPGTRRAQPFDRREEARCTLYGRRWISAKHGESFAKTLIQCATSIQRTHPHHGYRWLWQWSANGPVYPFHHVNNKFISHSRVICIWGDAGQRNGILKGYIVRVSHTREVSRETRCW